MSCTGGGAGSVEIDASGLVEGATGDPVIRVDVVSDAERFGAAEDGRMYEVVNRFPGPGVVALVGRDPAKVFQGLSEGSATD